MKGQIITAAEVARLSWDCASTLTPNSQDYTAATVGLLLGTAAHESAGFRYARQMRYRPDSTGGAFGLWQCEAISVENTFNKLRERPPLARVCAAWAFNVSPGLCTGRTLENALGGVQGACVALMISPRVACLFARMHYLWIPRPIPKTLEGQAQYWKRWYNTAAGAGTVEDYLESVRKHITDERDEE